LQAAAAWVAAAWGAIVRFGTLRVPRARNTRVAMLANAGWSGCSNLDGREIRHRHQATIGCGHPRRTFMTHPSFQAFETDMRAKGYPDVAVRDYPTATEAPDHTHEFAVKALVVRGEMWLTVGGDTRHLLVGDTFELDHEVVHAERYGSEGATYWAARRHKAN
jgi:hypothetical protein